MENNEEKLNSYNHFPIMYSLYEYLGCVYYTMFGIFDFKAESENYWLSHPEFYVPTEDFYNEIMSIRNEIIKDMIEIGAYIPEDYHNILYYKNLKLSDCKGFRNYEPTFMSYYWRGYQIGKYYSYELIEELLSIYREERDNFKEEYGKYIELKPKVYKK